MNTLKAALASGDPGGESGPENRQVHAEWLQELGSILQRAPCRPARMYVDDPRFTAYYDEQVQAGATRFLRDAILIYTGGCS